MVSTEMLEVCFSSIDTQFGKIFFAASAKGLIEISLYHDYSGFQSYLADKGYIPEENSDTLSETGSQLSEYFNLQRKTFDLNFDLSSLTQFQRKVLQSTTSIPYGQVASYKDVASMIGNINAVRAVANTLASNPLPIVIPCHRVIYSNRQIGNYSIRHLGPDLGSEVKHRLLKMEGYLLN